MRDTILNILYGTLAIMYGTPSILLAILLVVEENVELRDVSVNSAVHYSAECMQSVVFGRV